MTDRGQQQTRRSFMSDFRLFFVRGLAILLPSVLTIWLLWAAYSFVENRIAEPINSGIRQGVLWVMPRIDENYRPQWARIQDEQVQLAREERARQGMRRLSDQELRKVALRNNFRDWWDAHWYLRGIGFVVAITLFYLAGVLLGNYLGRRMYTRIEALLARIPLVRAIYPNVKQVVDFLLGENQMAFKRVVLVEYPRKGIWTIGLHTGRALRATDAIAGECYTVFIPSSPTPFTGYTIIVPVDEVHDIPVTIDEALRFVVSGGVLVPPEQRVAEEQDAQASEAVREPRSGARGLALGAGGAKIPPTATPPDAAPTNDDPSRPPRKDPRT